MPREKTEYWTRHAVRKGKPVVHFHYHGETHIMPAEEALVLATEMWHDANTAISLAGHGMEEVEPKSSDAEES